MAPQPLISVIEPNESARQPPITEIEHITERHPNLWVSHPILSQTTWYFHDQLFQFVRAFWSCISAIHSVWIYYYSYSYYDSINRIIINRIPEKNGTTSVPSIMPLHRDESRKDFNQIVGVNGFRSNLLLLCVWCSRNARQSGGRSKVTFFTILDKNHSVLLVVDSRVAARWIASARAKSCTEAGR